MDLFLWPMLIPLTAPLVYTLMYEKNSLKSIFGLIVVMCFIVVIYGLVISFSWFGFLSYAIWKTVLFVVLPLLFLIVFEKKNIQHVIPMLGVKKNGLNKSIRLGLMLIPVMLAVTGFVLWMLQSTIVSSAVFAIVSFFESFTEEFLFRGVLFLFLMKKTNTSIAMITSIACFVLAHPQHFTSLFIVPTIVQAMFTVFIVYRSKNLAGAWLLHGVNRVASLIVFPILFSQSLIS